MRSRRTSLRTDRRGTAAVEFALVASVFIVLVLGELEFGRLIWILQALQVTGQQTARCVAIGSSACASAASYAVSVASAHGVVGLTNANVQVTSVTGTGHTGCNPPASNTMVQVKITLAFSSTVATLFPGLNQNLVSTSCYPLTGT
jgi:Flp pilus assembly protein TadG